MSETQKQRIRRFLDDLTLDDEMRRSFEEVLESVTEEECEGIIHACEKASGENPEILDEIMDAYRHFRPDTAD